MLFREMIAVYPENHIYTVSKVQRWWVTVKARGTYPYLRALKG
jgi:hypothetical protein